MSERIQSTKKKLSVQNQKIISLKDLLSDGPTPKYLGYPLSEIYLLECEYNIVVQILVFTGVKDALQLIRIGNKMYGGNHILKNFEKGQWSEWYIDENIYDDVMGISVFKF